MHHGGLLIAARATLTCTLVAVIVAGCGADEQAASGPGWRLVDLRSGNVGPGIDVKPLGDDAYLVEPTVNGPGGKDCARPRFIGFEARGDVLVASFERPAVTETCLITGNRIFDVLLERRFIPSGVSRLELSEPCSNDQPAPGCPQHGVAIDGPWGTPLPVPPGSIPSAAS